MPRSVTCEIQQNGRWVEISVADALKLTRGTRKRCVECHGPVRSHRAGGNGGAHVEHLRRHKGCSRGDCFSGSKSLHPQAI